jgi:hypothetical protein
MILQFVFFPAGHTEARTSFISPARGRNWRFSIAGAYLLRYAQEASWREDNRSVSNGEQVNRLAGLALKAKPSVDFGGYWQRHVEAAN